MQKKALIIVLSFGILTTGFISASALVRPKTKAELLSELTGKSVQKIEGERLTSKTYGQVASDNDVLDEFQAKRIENHKQFLQEKVANGSVTQEQADQIISQMKQNQANCDGSGNGIHHKVESHHNNTGTHHGMGYYKGNGFHRGR